MLEFKVKLINRANNWFNNSFEIITEVLKPLDGKKLIKRDGGFVKTVVDQLYGFQFITDEVKGTLSYDKLVNGWLSVTLVYQVRNRLGNWEKHETTRTLGKVEDGILVKITNIPVFSTNLTVEKATEIQNRIDRLGKELREAQDEFRKYITF